MKIKRTFLLLVFSNLLILNSFSQDLSIKNRWNIKLSYANFKSFAHYSIDNYTYFGHANFNFQIEGNYRISRFIEAGLYAGILQFETGYNVTNGNVTYGGPSDKIMLPVYGANFNFHLLPLFIKKDNLRLDIYATGKFGAINFKTPEYYHTHGIEYEYSIGGGGSFYFTKHVGVFAEYCYGKFSDMRTKNLKLGLTIKF